jgi:RNA polymerase sigma factor (sigma-70 family)
VNEAHASEAELIARSQKGNVAAFNQLVLLNQDVAYGVALRILGDPDAAADATQEAFISAFQAVGSLRGGSFRVWLLRIVTNACLDMLRAKKRRPSNSLDDLLNAEDGSGGPADTAFETPEEHALRLDMQAEVQRSLQQLPADQRIAVILSDVHGLSYEEIAQVTKSGLGTVKSRISRGRAHLRDLLRQRELMPSTRRL